MFAFPLVSESNRCSYSALAATLLAYKHRIPIPALLPAVAWCLWLQLPVADPRDGTGCGCLTESGCTASSSPGHAVILQDLQELNWDFLCLPHPLFPVLSVPTVHSHWGYVAIRKHYHKTSKSNFENEVSMKEFGILAPEAKCWFTENTVHCQVATKPGLMSSVHWLQPREMLSLLDSVLWSLLRLVFPHVSAETAKLEMNNLSFLFFLAKGSCCPPQKSHVLHRPTGLQEPNGSGFVPNEMSILSILCLLIKNSLLIQHAM